MTAHVDVLDLMSRLKAAEEPFVLATVVRTVSVTAAKAGAKAIIRPDGRIEAGWIGGGCARVIDRHQRFVVRLAHEDAGVLDAHDGVAGERAGDQRHDRESDQDAAADGAQRRSRARKRAPHGRRSIRQDDLDATRLHSLRACSNSLRT